MKVINRTIFYSPRQHRTLTIKRWEIRQRRLLFSNKKVFSPTNSCQNCRSSSSSSHIRLLSSNKVQDCWPSVIVCFLSAAHLNRVMVLFYQHKLSKITICSSSRTHGDYLLVWSSTNSSNNTILSTSNNSNNNNNQCREMELVFCL